MPPARASKSSTSSSFEGRLTARGASAVAASAVVPCSLLPSGWRAVVILFVFSYFS